MISAKKPANEVQRLEALERYKILDTLTEQTYDDITRLATNICGTEIAVISLVDKERQWFKSAVGLEAAETHRDVAFCSHAILQSSIMVVPDALEDRRFHDNPLVVNEPRIRFYAGAPLQTSDGYPLGTLCVIDRKPRTLSQHQFGVLEALSRQVMCLLELRLNLMNLADATQQLENARDTAVQLSDSKSAFLATVSHEIRTPMNGIIGMTEFLKNSGLSPEQSEYLNGIDVSAKSLLTMVNDILDSSKIEAGKLCVESLDFDLGKTISDVEMNFRIEAREKKIKLDVATPPMSHHLVGDGLRVRQILLNLVGNAMKFTKSGFVKAETKIVSRDEESTKLRFEVHDTGPGIPADKLQHLFQDFSQADSTVARNYGGTGLGLSISKRLVNLMKGRIGVESVEGEGSVFWFEIEFKNGSALTRPNVAVVAAPSKIETHFTKAEAGAFRILAADDNLMNQKLIAKSLEVLGFTVTMVANGAEALQALQRQHFDLVLMDGQMPEMDGYAATKAIRNSAGPLSSIPIIAITANSSQEDEAFALRSGMNDFLPKPFSRDKLVEKLARWLKPDRLKIG